MVVWPTSLVCRQNKREAWIETDREEVIIRVPHRFLKEDKEKAKE
jgi:hypothetical protein